MNGWVCVCVGGDARTLQKVSGGERSHPGAERPERGHGRGLSGLTQDTAPQAARGWGRGRDVCVRPPPPRLGAGEAGRSGAGPRSPSPRGRGRGEAGGTGGGSPGKAAEGCPAARARRSVRPADRSLLLKEEEEETKKKKRKRKLIRIA